MKRIYAFAALALLLLLALALTSCNTALPTPSDNLPDETPANPPTDPSESTPGAVEKDTTTFADISAMFSSRDMRPDVDNSKAVAITLNGSTATCSSKAVSISENRVVIRDEGTYVISGRFENGMIIVDAGSNDKLQLVLNGVTVKSHTSAAIYVRCADKVFVTSPAGKANFLSNEGKFVAIDDSTIDAAVFSKEDITFNGDGSLSVISPVGHGIAGKDDVVFYGGNYEIEAGIHGVDANDSVRIMNSRIHVISGKDAIKAENTSSADKGFVYVHSGQLDLFSGGDGIASSLYTQIDDGNINIKAAKAENATSIRGIKGRTGVLIRGGELNISAEDDALHSDKDLIISGGSLQIATNDAALHADGRIRVTNASIFVSQSGESIESIDLEIRGTTFVAFGSQTEPNRQAPIGQGMISIAVGESGKGTKIRLVDSEGSEILSAEAKQDFSSLDISNYLVIAKKTYKLYVGESEFDVVAD